MVSASLRSCGASWLLFFFGFCLAIASSTPVCPTRPPAGHVAVPPLKAFLPHPETQAEWYYLVGSLCQVHSVHANVGPSCEHPVGFEINTILKNVTLSDGSTTITANTLYALTYGDEHYTTTVLGVPNYPNPQQLFDLQFISDDPLYTASYTLLSGTPAFVGSLYNIVASTPNMTINLFMRSLSPLMLHGNLGFVGINTNPATCDAFFYVSMPHLQTWGTVRLNDEIHFVAGNSWLDHQWGVFGAGTSPGGGGWMFVGMHIGNSSLFMLVERVHYEFNVLESIVEVQKIDGNMAYGFVTNIEVLRNWTSPTTGNIYPIEMIVTTTHPAATQIQFIPYFDDQEVFTLVQANWEGDSKVHILEGTLRAEQHHGKGVGQLELVGFSPSG